MAMFCWTEADLGLAVDFSERHEQGHRAIVGVAEPERPAKPHSAFGTLVCGPFRPQASVAAE